MSGDAHETITCLDQLNGPLGASIDGQIQAFDAPETLLSHLKMKPRRLFLSYADHAGGVQEYGAFSLHVE